MSRPSSAPENKLRQQGYSLIAGLDEVGRGPLAGPVVAAAVILLPGVKIPGLNDSKKLSAQQRESLAPLIRASSLAVGVGLVSHKMIDRLNIYRASLLAMKLAVLKLPILPDFLLIDGSRNKVNVDLPQEAIAGGDAKVASIAAASVVAKVVRDRIMLKYHNNFPGYRFDLHKGYGTRKHYEALKRLGPSEIHRKSFALVAE